MAEQKDINGTIAFGYSNCQEFVQAIRGHRPKVVMTRKTDEGRRWQASFIGKDNKVHDYNTDIIALPAKILMVRDAAVDVSADTLQGHIQVDEQTGTIQQIIT